MTGVRRHKYNVAPAKDRKYRNRTYHSKGEMEHARRLDLMVGAGEIRWWARQVPVDLTDDDCARIDFMVVDKDGAVRFDEYKGVDTTEWKRIKRLWVRHGPAPLHVIRKGGVTDEVIVPESL